MKNLISSLCGLVVGEAGGTRPPDAFSYSGAAPTRPEAGFHLSEGVIHGSNESPTASIKLGLVGIALLLIVALLLFGCGDSVQQLAYEHAVQSEAQHTGENAAAIIAEYKQVIALQPGSAWAKQAQTRIEAVEAKAKAEELHKSVFQEHGVD